MEQSSGALNRLEIKGIEFMGRYAQNAAVKKSTGQDILIGNNAEIENVARYLVDGLS